MHNVQQESAIACAIILHFLSKKCFWSAFRRNAENQVSRENNWVRYDDVGDDVEAVNFAVKKLEKDLPATCSRCQDEMTPDLKKTIILVLQSFHLLSLPKKPSHGKRWIYFHADFRGRFPRGYTFAMVPFGAASHEWRTHNTVLDVMT